MPSSTHLLSVFSSAGALRESPLRRSSYHVITLPLRCSFLHPRPHLVLSVYSRFCDTRGREKARNMPAKSRTAYCYFDVEARSRTSSRGRHARVEARGAPRHRMYLSLAPWLYCRGSVNTQVISAKVLHDRFQGSFQNSAPDLCLVGEISSVEQVL